MSLQHLRVGLLASACLWFAAPANAQCHGGGGNIGIQPTPPPYRGPGDMVGNTSPSPAAPAAAAPMAPAPAAPQAQMARGPVMPSVGMASGQAPNRGAPISFTHRATTLGELHVDWTYPSFEPERSEGITVAPKVYKALPIAEALQRLAGDDQRPLLVLRECWVCSGTDHALLDRKMANEKTILFSRWFHCVRLDDSVRHENHPCHLLFKEQAMPHVLLCSRDGSTMVPLDGRRTQSQLWSSMRKVLKAGYEKDPDEAVRSLFQILGQYDHLDSLESEISARLQTVLNTQSKDSPRARELEAERAKVAAERDALKRRQADVMDLRLKVAAPAKAD